MEKATRNGMGAMGGPDAPANEFPLRLKMFRWLGKQTWIPKGQDWVLRQIWHPESGRPFQFEVDFFGLRYRGDLAEFIDWNVFAYGSYSYCELSLLDALTREVRKSKSQVHFFDVGANVGHHTLFMAGITDQVIAFEPFPELRRLIEQKVSVNHLTNIQIVPYALGEQDGTLQYFPGGRSNLGNGTFLPEEIGSYKRPVEAQIRNGDRLFAELNLPRMDLLKVDVEGFEPFVFRGLVEHLHRDRPPILTEMSDRSRAGFGSESAFKALFWDGAVFAEVGGRNGCPFHLKPLCYATAQEVLIVPPEMADFVRDRIGA